MWRAITSKCRACPVAPAETTAGALVAAGPGQSRASLNFVYEITDATRTQVLTRGTTQHAVVNAQGRPVRIPDWLSALFV